MITSFELVEDSTEKVDGLCSKGADRATKQLQSLATAVLWPFPFLLIGSELYEAVLSRMTLPKQARLRLRRSKRYSWRLEGGEEDSSEDNPRAAVGIERA